MEALELCLKCDNSVFHKKHLFQTDGTAQSPYISEPDSEIAIEQFGKKH